MCYRVSVSRRTFGPGNVNVHAWFGLTPQLTKCIWSMAVAQHQFYHERKSSKVCGRFRERMKEDLLIVLNVDWVFLVIVIF